MALTFGIEVEAIVVKRRQSQTPLPAIDLKQLQLVSDCLTASGLQSRVFIPTARTLGPDFTIWNVVQDITIEELTSQSDSSPSGAVQRFGVEIVSPIFRLDDASWRTDISKAVQAVSAELVWKANRSAGFHVHVGTTGADQSDEFTLSQLKRIAVMVIRFEASMDSYHPTHRIEGNHKYNVQP
ncbi:hypothetical protein BDV98DRAFT_576240 [Pterulicium gracile]|uniref:Amidoligase enzyme-domain-containing protein n=1 Tax=Pterulicium gracile TaxID=1884261 RepID=A0A5C3Q877_9AGAR|nr:hypothetical protein BDV98DRAFT_576240 [Pterula gracilis]